MYFSFPFVLAVLPFLVGAVPFQNSARSAFSVPLSKRTILPNANGVVNAPNLQASIHYTIAFVFLFSSSESVGSFTKRPFTRKFEKGFEAYKKNTGEAHPLAPKVEHRHKHRSGVTVPLSDYNNSWNGNILVGTPAAPYNGRSLFLVAQT